MKKIIVAADTYYPKVDGTLKFMEKFIHLNKNILDISLLVPYLGVKKGRNVTYIDVSKIISLSGYPHMKLSWSNLKRIKTAIKQSETIFVQGPGMISYLSIYFGRKFQKKTVMYIHTISWELFEKFLPPLLNKLFLTFIKRFSIILYNKCDLILVPYHDLKDQLHRAGIKKTIKVARLGVDIERFRPPENKYKSKQEIGIDPDKNVVGFVGRVSKEKNIDILLEAFMKLKNQENLHLLIVGDGSEELTSRCRSLKNCTVTGFVDNVEKYLHAMDVFVMPSLTETTSLATLEAMASGLPVVASKIGYMKYYITRNYNGLFFPRNSPTMLALKIEKILNNAEIRSKFSKNARRMVTYSFSWERSISRIRRILNEI